MAFDLLHQVFHDEAALGTNVNANTVLTQRVGHDRSDGGDAHPAHALYDELDQINGYTSQYHHGEDMGDITPDQIDPVELTGYVRRTLRIVNALQA